MKSYLLAGAALAVGTVVLGTPTAAVAQQSTISIPPGDLKSALDAYVRETGRQLIYRPDEVSGIHSPGAQGHLTPDAALNSLLSGTGFTIQNDASGAVAVVRAVGNGPTNGESIVVTGIRQSLASAEAIKKNADQLVDSITAQDIGRFPDVDVAESLQRIPGIQIQRNLGEGSVVAIRGLSDIRTELDGHDIFTANGGVGLSFEEIGPDLLSRVDVYKNPSAKMIEGSLGGTIDLRTRMPFDAEGQVIAATVSGTRYDLAKKNGWGASALYSNRWQTAIGEIGLLLNASAQKSDFRQDLDQVEPYIWHGPISPSPDGGELQPSPVPGYESQDIQVPKGGGFNVAGGDRRRTSASAVLQWRPTSSVEAYAQFLTTTYHFRDTGVSFFATDDTAAPTGAYTVKNGVATSGELVNPGGISITYGANRRTRTSDFTTGVKWSITDRLHLVLDYQHIDASVRQDSMTLYITPYTSTNGVPGLFTANYDYVFDNRGKFPTQLAVDPVTGQPSDFFANPANYGYTAIQPDRTWNEAHGDTPRADLTWDFDDGSFIKSVSTGVRYSRKTAINRDTNVNNWITIGGTCANWSSASNCYKVSDFPQFVENNPGQATLLRGAASDLVFGPILQWQLSDALNPDAAFAHVKQISGQDISFGSFDNPNQSTTSSVREKDYAGYLLAEFGSDLGNMSWDGNVGVRFVKTDEVGTGFQVVSYRTAGTGTTPSTVSTVSNFSGGRSYQTWLPSVNLRLHITPKLQARLALSKNIYRPTFTQLNPSYSLSPNYNGQDVTPLTVDTSRPYDPVTNPYQGSGSVSGNPNLKPERVTSFDGALEWYFARTGYAYLTLFKKNLRDIIDTRTFFRTETIPNVGVVQFNVSAVTNVTKGHVQGFEVGGQKFFDFLPGAFSGLGVQANYTRADSDAGTIASGTIGGAAFKVPLINLSRDSYNLVALYDKYGLNVRVAYNWRSKYLDSINETGAQTLPIYFKPYGSLDASISYDFNKHVTVSIDGQNLTDTVNYSYQGQPIYLRNYQINDRRYSARLSVRF
jgi:TonB-dependent receptor